MAQAAAPGGDGFLTRSCANNQTALGQQTGLCANCPTIYPTVAAAQAAADSDAQQRYANEVSANTAGRPYCGSVNVIRKWMLYSQCHGAAQPTFRNPFHFSHLGTPPECFQSGRNVGMLIGSNNRPPGGGGGGAGVPPALLPPPPAPLIPAPILPVAPRRGRPRRAAARGGGIVGAAEHSRFDTTTTSLRDYDVRARERRERAKQRRETRMY